LKSRPGRGEKRNFNLLRRKKGSSQSSYTEGAEVKRRGGKKSTFLLREKKGERRGELYVYRHLEREERGEGSRRGGTERLTLFEKGRRRKSMSLGGKKGGKNGPLIYL